MQLDDIALSMYSYNDGGALWQGIPVQETTNTPTWQWSQYERITVPGDLDAISQLIQADWQRLDAGSWNNQGDHGKQYLRLCGQLANVLLMEMPGNSSDYQMWAPRADIERSKAIPVSLSFARIDMSEIDALSAVRYAGESGLTLLHIEQMLPPPQFGELALVDTQMGNVPVWKIYKLSALGEAGFDVWLRMGKALKELAAPAEWWPHTPRLEACLNGQYDQVREHMRSQLLTTRGEARETWRRELAALEIDRKHAQALQSARQRARKDPRAWLDQWQEIRAMAVELASLYWHVHITQADHNAASIAIDEPITVDSNDMPPSMIDASGVVDAVPATPIPQTNDPENDADLARLALINESNSATHLLVGNYAEDEAVRKAAFRAADGKSWREDQGLMRFEHRSLGVYLGDPHHPMPLEEAQAKLREIRESAVLTMRIGMGLWNLRRYNQELAKNGAVAVTATEILAWRGVKKHERLAHPGTASTEKRTDGWDSREVDDVHRDLTLAEMFYLHGSHRVKVKGRWETFTVTSRYITVSPIRHKDLWGHEELVGFYFSPGDWINAYDDKGVWFLTPADRRIFQLNPQNEQHEVRIALYLVERWRKLANDHAYSDPITMADLLAESVIPIDARNLTNRFAPRIESALTRLQRVGIIGEAICLSPVDKGKARWGKDWLAARWRIMPSQATLAALEEAVRGGNPTSLPPGKSGKGK